MPGSRDSATLPQHHPPSSVGVPAKPLPCHSHAVPRAPGSEPRHHLCCGVLANTSQGHLRFKVAKQTPPLVGRTCNATWKRHGCREAISWGHQCSQSISMSWSTSQVWDSRVGDVTQYFQMGLPWNIQDAGHAHTSTSPSTARSRDPPRTPAH